VVDPVANKRLRRIDLGGIGSSITVTREAAPQLVVARPDGNLDVFDATSGTLVRRLGATAAFNPLILVPGR
jgi:methylamine dehydrogenase heavy chain